VSENASVYEEICLQSPTKNRQTVRNKNIDFRFIPHGRYTIIAHVRGVLTCVEWQVTLCDPIWQVTLRSCEMEFHQQLYTSFTFTFTFTWHGPMCNSFHLTIFVPNNCICIPCFPVFVVILFYRGFGKQGFQCQGKPSMYSCGCYTTRALVMCLYPALIVVSWNNDIDAHFEHKLQKLLSLTLRRFKSDRDET